MLERLVDLRAGERRPLTMMGALLALVIGAHTIVETARDTLFLRKLPPNRLAWVYVALAVATLLAGRVASSITERFGQRSGFVMTLVACAYVVVLLGILPATPLFVFTLYVASGVMGTLLLLAFWVFAGRLFTVAQGKRLFGPLAAFGIVGATIGATVASVISRFFSASALLVLAAVLFLSAAVVVTMVPDSEDSARAAPTTRTAPAGALLGEPSLVVRGPYLRIVAALTFVSSITVLFADYLFKSSAAVALAPDELGPFLGGFYAAQNALALVVQLGVTTPLVRRAGVPSALLLFPTLLLFGALGAMVSNVFAFAVVVKIIDGALRHSLHRVTSELLVLPIAPPIRDRAKRVLDAVVARGGQALGAGGIALLGVLGVASISSLGLCIAGLAATWIVVAGLTRRPYLDMFRRSLARGDDPEEFMTYDLPVVETLLASLASDQDDRVRAAIQMLARPDNGRLVPALILHHDSPAVLTLALEVLSRDRARRDFLPLTRRLLGHRDASVRVAAVRALAVAGDASVAGLALEDGDPTVRASALFFLASGDDPEADPRVSALLERRDDDGARERHALVSAIAAHGDARWARVVRRIATTDRARRGVGERGLAREIAVAARVTNDPEHAPLLVALLLDREARTDARASLVALGPAAQAVVERAFADPNTSMRLRRQLPRALAAFGNQRAVDFLVRALDRELDLRLRYKVLRALGRASADAKRGALKFDRRRFEREATLCFATYLRLFEAVVELGHTPSLAPTHAGSLLEVDRPATRLCVGLIEERARLAFESGFRFLQLAHRTEDLEACTRRSSAEPRRALDRARVPGFAHGAHAFAPRARPHRRRRSRASRARAPRTRRRARRYLPECGSRRAPRWNGSALRRDRARVRRGVLARGRRARARQVLAGERRGLHDQRRTHNRRRRQRRRARRARALLAEHPRRDPARWLRRGALREHARSRCRRG
ncbi:MAG: hypothetical protein U0271_10845 [Polyangiaceae bacterium]